MVEVKPDVSVPRSGRVRVISYHCVPSFFITPRFAHTGIGFDRNPLIGRKIPVDHTVADRLHNVGEPIFGPLGMLLGHKQQNLIVHQTHDLGTRNL